MSKPRLKKESTKGNPLVGTWISGNDYGSDVEYTVISDAGGFKVHAVDRDDGEAADVFEVKWDGRILSFATHWNSTGHFLRCRFELVAKNEVSFTYTYTANEIWRRKLT